MLHATAEIDTVHMTKNIYPSILRAIYVLLLANTSKKAMPTVTIIL